MAASERTEPFADNWSYLKVELNWLEKVLLTAVARQKKEGRDVDRLAKTKADRASGAWWQGLVDLEGKAGYDSPPPKPGGISYAQQLGLRVGATPVGVLALPELCGRLGLSPFEKNLLLMGLAPEVHRRYGQLYEYLCGGGLTVDLALRLLCRDDREWRKARMTLDAEGTLRRHGLIELSTGVKPLLQKQLVLPEGLVSYLLAEVPEGLDRLVSPAPIYLETPAFAVGSYVGEGIAPQLVLPEGLRHAVEGLVAGLRSSCMGDWQGVKLAGRLVLLVGPEGTGKRSLAHGMAQTLGLKLMSVDLEMVGVSEYEALLGEIERVRPPVLLVRGAQRWLRGYVGGWERLVRVRRDAVLTLFSTERGAVMGVGVRSVLDQRLVLPMPDRGARRRIWQGCFAPQVTFGEEMDWEGLASLEMSGGEIAAVARAVVGRYGVEGITMGQVLGMLQGRRLTRPKKGS